jgi:ABC-2 type transport system permease protein
MARHFLELRLAALRNRVLALRSDSNKRGSAIVSAMIFGWLASKYGPGVLDSLRATGAVPSAELVLPMLSFSVLLSWVLGPLAGYGAGPFAIDNFRLLPLSPKQLAIGILCGSVLSPGLAVSAAFVGVTLSGFSTTPAAWVVIVAATLVLLALCIVSGRVVGLGVGVLSRHRRSRDLLVVITLPVSMLPLFLLFEVSRAYKDPTAGSPIAAAVQWVPLAWPGRAMAAAIQGQQGEAIGFLLASVAVLVAGGWLVARLVHWALTGEDRSHAPLHGSAHPFAQFARRLPSSRRGAVAAATIRGLVRDSARIPQLLMGTLVLGGMFTAIGVAVVAQSDQELAALGAIGLAFVPMTRRLNELSITGPAYWMDVVAPGSARDDLLGRDLAAVLVDVPLCLVVVTAVAVGTRGYAWLPVALAFVAAAVAVSYTVTRVSSVLFATGQTVAKDATARTGGGRDPRSMGIQLASMAGVMVGSAPIVAAVVEIVQDGSTWVVPLVVGVLVYGALVYAVGLSLVAKWLAVNEPAVLAKLGG